MGCSSYPPKQNAKRFTCLIKCKSALARAPKVLRGIGLRTNRRQPIRLCTHCLASSHFLLIPSRYADARDAGRDCACVGHSKMYVETVPLLQKLPTKPFASRTLFTRPRMPSRFAILVQHLCTGKHTRKRFSKGLAFLHCPQKLRCTNCST